MLPMSIRSNTCGNYVYVGTKFNSRKEKVIGITYLTNCKAELTIKTDPKNLEYVVESGARRYFEHWRREEDEEVDRKRRRRGDEEMGDVMNSLENKTLDSKRDMDVHANLHEIKSMKARHSKVSLDAALDVLQLTAAAERNEKGFEEEDEEMIKVIFSGSKKSLGRRIDDDVDEEDDLKHIKKRKGSGEFGSATDNLRKDCVNANAFKKPKFSFLAKKKNSIACTNIEAKEEKRDEEPSAKETNPSLLSLLQSYESDDESH